MSWRAGENFPITVLANHSPAFVIYYLLIQMSANSKASQLLNWFGNFLSANANAARDLIVDPVVDLWSYAAKWYARWWAMLLWKDPDKAAAAVDKVADVLKTGWGYNAKQEVDPTSIAWAIGDWLIRWVDQAAAVLTLTEAAKQLPKAAQKWWTKILNKVKDAKSKSDQIKLAKEAREYINSYNNSPSAASLMQRIDDEVPAYQQRYLAEQHNALAKKLEKNPLVNSSSQDLREMEKYTWLNRIPDGEMRTLRDATKYTEAHRWIDNVPDLVDPYRTFYAEENIKNAPYAGNVRWPMIPNNLRWRQWVWSVSPEVNEQIRKNAYRKWTYADNAKKSTWKKFAKQRAAADKAAQAAGIEDYDTAKAIANYIQEDIKTSPEKYVWVPVSIKNWKYTAQDFIRDSMNYHL